MDALTDTLPTSPQNPEYTFGKMSSNSVAPHMDFPLEGTRIFITGPVVDQGHHRHHRHHHNPPPPPPHFQIFV